MITIDVDSRPLELDVDADADELDRRASAWVRPRVREGVLARFSGIVSSASRGAVVE